MPDFTQDPWTQLGHLRDILKNYQEEDILKELLQNADDAGATHLRIALHPGIPNAPHPLLCFPALVAANDGKFTPENQSAISRLRLGSKGGDAASIGRFGLGLKSVFHLCEAFFITASGYEATPFHLLLNPWAQTLHKDWEQDDASTALLGVISAWVPDWPRWFSLWIPLRNRALLSNKAPLVEHYPPPESLPRGCTGAEAARCLPFLKSVQHISSGRWADSGFETLWCLHRAIPELDSIPREPQHAGASDGRVSILGLKRAEHSTLAWCGRCLVKEAPIEAHPALKQLLQNDAWPKETMIDQRTGEGKQVPVAMNAHAGVALLRLPPDETPTEVMPPEAVGHTLKREHEHLRLTYASYLPISRNSFEAPLTHNMQVELLLHGTFFLDSGRTRLIKEENNPTSAIESKWNRYLEIEALALIPSAIRDFCAADGFSVEHARGLTQALRDLLKIEDFKDVRAYLTRDHQWLFCLNENGGQWRLFPAQTPFLELPTHQDPTFPLQVFPGLSALTQKQVLTFAEWPDSSRRAQEGAWPRLTANPAQPWAANSKEFVALLKRLEDSPALGNLEQFTYLIDVMSLQRGQLQLSPNNRNRLSPATPDADSLLDVNSWNSASDKWIGVFNRWLEKAGPERLDAHPKQWERLLSLLPSTRWVALDLEAGKDRPHELATTLKGIWTAHLDQLVLLRSALPKSGSAHGHLEVANARRILELLRDLTATKGKRTISIEFAARAAVEVWRHCSDKAELQHHCGDLELFRVHDYNKVSELRASWNQLEMWRKGERLFLSTANTLANALQKALPSLTFFRLVEDPKRSEVSEVLYTDTHPLECNEEFCTRLLAQKPELDTNPGQRTDLLKALLRGQNPSDSIRRAARYLIHHHKGHFDDLASPLFVPSEEKSLWAHLAHEIRVRCQQEWRTVPREINDALETKQRGILMIAPQDQTAVERLLRDHLAEARKIPFGDAHRLQLLESLNDVLLWHELPIHRTVDGKTVSASARNTYRFAGRKPPPLLGHRLTILEAPRDWRVYWFSEKWSPV